ncbi:lactate utilization protein [Candidatus Woesearchaeota archaeon]|nr:lactate utilization protein [Candidatus Woesearchaeota archaeon]
MDKVIAALKSRNMNGYFVKDREEAREKALSLIDKDMQISFAGSVTLRETGLLDELRKGGYKLIDRDLAKPNLYMKHWVMKNYANKGIFLSGSNALTEDGKIVNMDGWGNRVNGINYGPEKVIIVAGRNKIVKDLDAAVQRIARVASPKNTKRLGKGTPCAEKGECVDCRSPDRICNILSVVQFQNIPDRIHVIIVNEELGY